MENINARLVRAFTRQCSHTTSAATPTSAPTVTTTATAASASTATATADTTSAAYPLLAIVPGNFFHMYENDEYPNSSVCPEKEFNDLVRAEADALDSVTTSDSSSVTDTEWIRCSYSYSGELTYRCRNLYENTHKRRESGDEKPDDFGKMYLQQNSFDDCVYVKQRDRTSYSPTPVQVKLYSSEF